MTLYRRDGDAILTSKWLAVNLWYL